MNQTEFNNRLLRGTNPGIANYEDVDTEVNRLWEYKNKGLLTLKEFVWKCRQIQTKLFYEKNDIKRS
jgi:hypothetical protein